MLLLARHGARLTPITRVPQKYGVKTCTIISIFHLNWSANHILIEIEVGPLAWAYHILFFKKKNWAYHILLQRRTRLVGYPSSTTPVHLHTRAARCDGYQTPKETGNQTKSLRFMPATKGRALE